MTDQDLEVLYKQNINESHAAGLRGVFDAGYNYGANVSQVIVQQVDPSLAIQLATVTTDDPNNIPTA